MCEGVIRVTSSAGMKTSWPSRPRWTTIQWKMASSSDPSSSTIWPTASPSELRTGVSCSTPRQAIGCSGSCARSGSSWVSGTPLLHCWAGLVHDAASRMPAGGAISIVPLERSGDREGGNRLAGTLAARIEDRRRRELAQAGQRGRVEHVQLPEYGTHRHRAGATRRVAVLDLHREPERLLPPRDAPRQDPDRREALCAALRDQGTRSGAHQGGVEAPTLPAHQLGTGHHPVADSLERAAQRLVLDPARVREPGEEERGPLQRHSEAHDAAAIGACLHRLW